MGKKVDNKFAQYEDDVDKQAAKGLFLNLIAFVWYLSVGLFSLVSLFFSLFFKPFAKALFVGLFSLVKALPSLFFSERSTIKRSENSGAVQDSNLGQAKKLEWVTLSKIENPYLNMATKNHDCYSLDYSEKVLHLGVYIPRKFKEDDEFSSKILDLKNNDIRAKAYFLSLLNTFNFDNTEAIVVMPSHLPNARPNALKSLAEELASSHSWIDAVHCLVRTKKIDKLATGGNRSLSTQLSSLDVVNPDMIKGLNVLVLDDVTTSGNSLKAAMKVLLESGAASVSALSLGRTKKMF